MNQGFTSLTAVGYANYKMQRDVLEEDLIAIVKDVGEQRTTKSGLVVADVTLIDNSETSAGVLATIKVGVFGHEKVEVLRQHVGEPMVFFNLSINFADGHLSISHFPGDLIQPAVDRRRVLGRDDALRGKHCGMRAAGGDVLPPQHLVEGNRGIDFAHDRARPFGEPAAPHLVGDARVLTVIAHVTCLGAASCRLR